MLSTHHMFNNQHCIPFWVKLWRNKAFSKAVLAFSKFHSNILWDCSEEKLKSWFRAASESVYLFLQSETSALGKNLVLSLRKFISTRGCWIGKHRLLSLLVKCRSSLQREQQFFSTISLHTDCDIQETNPSFPTAALLNELNLLSLRSIWDLCVPQPIPSPLFPEDINFLHHFITNGFSFFFFLYTVLFFFFNLTNICFQF